MYLKKFKLINFRKFAEKENEIEFTDSQGIKKPKMDQLILLQLQPYWLEKTIPVKQQFLRL
jgi:hypothetical protein